jgi:hypothetical protein
MSSLWHSASMTLVLALFLQACNGDDVAADESEAGNPVRAAEAATSEDDDCVRHVLESDLEPMPFAGPGVRDGAIAPGQFMIATTYLRLRADQSQLFQELTGAVIEDIVGRAGLIAIGTASSAACGTARTLTVWRDETAMLDFVVGKAHAKAMQSNHDISRGGSVAAEWMGDQASASWEAAAEHLANTDHQEY